MFKIYDITNVGASYFLRWLEKNIDGATQFHSVADSFRYDDTEIEPVEQGLSPGETRQALLDRYRNDFKRGKCKESVANLEGILDEMHKNKHGELAHSHASTAPIDYNDNPGYNDSNTNASYIVDCAESETLTLHDVEEFLYSLEDEKLIGMWVFADKLIYVFTD